MRPSAAWLFVIAACGGEAALGDAGGDAGGAVTVSFRQEVVPLINHCGGELCHGGIGPSWPYDALVNVVAAGCDDHRAIVKPGDPTHSYLIQKLSGISLCSGVQMPKLGVPFADADVKTVAAWIDQGAADN